MNMYILFKMFVLCYFVILTCIFFDKINVLYFTLLPSSILILLLLGPLKGTNSVDSDIENHFWGYSMIPIPANFFDSYPDSSHLGYDSDKHNFYE